MIIRDGKIEDAEAIAEIGVKTWQDTYKGIIPQEILDNAKVTKDNVEKIRESIFTNEDIFLIAEDNNKVIGFLRGGEARDEDIPYSFELYALYVLKDHQKSGAGSKLFSSFKQKISNAEFYLGMLKGNNSYKFYEKMGGVKLENYSKLIERQGYKLDEYVYTFKSS